MPCKKSIDAYYVCHKEVKHHEKVHVTQDSSLFGRLPKAALGMASKLSVHRVTR